MSSLWKRLAKSRVPKQRPGILPPKNKSLNSQKRSVNSLEGKTRLTANRNDPRLGHGVDDEPTGMNEAYLVLSDEERAKGFVRPVRTTYVHSVDLGGCGVLTTMGLIIAETYAAKPFFYGATFCAGCHKHRPVGQQFGEFYWVDNDGKVLPEKVGT